MRSFIICRPALYQTKILEDILARYVAFMEELRNAYKV
jgi:hypothetical protein